MKDTKLKLLIAEDAPEIAKVIAFGARMNWPNCQVTIATSGEEALQRFTELVPDLVVLDIAMPPPDGFEVCRRIRERSEVPILMLTARDETLDKIRALDLGADDYLTKPFEPAELVARVEVGLRVVQLQRSLSARVAELEDALAHVNRLERLLPICARCKRIQSGESWHDLENFLATSTGVRFSHGACPGCAEQWLAEDGFKG